MLIHNAYRAGHYNRALEEAIQTHKAQWARDWESKNPLAGGATFTTMSPAQRVCHFPLLCHAFLCLSQSSCYFAAQRGGVGTPEGLPASPCRCGSKLVMVVHSN
jgi:hypothetical protein